MSDESKVIGYVVSKPGSRKVYAYVVDKLPSPEIRQRKAMRKIVVTYVVIILAIVIMVSTQLTLHGFNFFVFRSSGTGASGDDALQENQGPGQPDSQVTLIATTPAGGQIVVHTTLQSDLAWAAVAQKKDGSWVMLAKGRGYSAVYSRAQLTWKNRSTSYRSTWIIVPLQEA